jgi:hypothetical protein
MNELSGVWAEERRVRGREEGNGRMRGRGSDRG